MRLYNLLRIRIARGISFLSLGPNEARIMYDVIAGFCALGASVVFLTLLMHLSVSLSVAVLPFFLVLMNTLLGIYSRFRTSSGRMKAFVLFISITLVTATGLAVLRQNEVVYLWGLLVVGPVILPRLFIGIKYSKHKNLATVVARQRGPVLVIGGAGYIGTHTVELLLQNGYSVRVLDRLMYGKDSIANFTAHKNFELIEGDTTDIAKLTVAMNGASSVVHLAGLVGDPACAVDRDFTRHTNIIATRMAKDVAQSMGVYRFVFASSCSVYGVSDVEVNEEDPLQPVSLYAQTKIDSEHELLYPVPDDFFVTVLRFATVFGHSRRPRFDLVANLFTAQAMTNGLITVVGPQQWRPFVHVRDLAKAILTVLRADVTAVQSQVFNVGNPELNLTILQLAEIIKDMTKSEREVAITVCENPQDQRNYRVSFQKIQTLLHYKPTVSMQEGVREMIEHFKQEQYRHYKDEVYNNVSVTRKFSAEYHDPLQTSNLYAPVGMGIPHQE